MSIVIPYGRPVIDIVGGTYDAPDDPLWLHLGNPEIVRRLAPVIAAVGRVDYVGHPSLSWGGTAFVVGPGLLMTNCLGPVLESGG